MMELITDTPLADADLPLAGFRAHLRFGTALPDSDLQDELLAGFLRAALVAVEGRVAKCLIERDFHWQLPDWPVEGGPLFPTDPVVKIGAVAHLSATVQRTDLSVENFYTAHTSRGSLLCVVPGHAPRLARGDSLRITFRAGMAPTWGDLPADLAQAVMMLAAHYYEYREDTALHGGCMPFGVSSLIQRYAPLRLAIGGRA